MRFTMLVSLLLVGCSPTNGRGVGQGGGTSQNGDDMGMSTGGGPGGSDGSVVGSCTPSQLPPPPDCAAQGIQIAPEFASSYSCVNLGTLASIPSPWGGFAMKANEPSTLLISGNSRDPSGRLYSVPIGRDASCHVTGFTGTTADYAEAPYNEAGIAYGPSGVLFLAQAVVNKLGELKPGSTVTNKTVDMAALGMGDSMCGVGFPPMGFGSTGQLKLINWPSPGFWYSADLADDGSGTFNVTNMTKGSQLANGAAGFVFIAAGNPGFPNNSILVSEYDAGTVVAYELDAQSNPKPTSRRVFIQGLTGAQGGVVDPTSGDFLFSTFSSALIIAVRGFAPPPPIQ
jgi:hypothetical protein